MLILIIDDSEVFRNRLVEMLSVNKNSKKFIEANNILEAKEIMQDFLPSILITDIRMPGGNGIDLIKEMRKNNQTTTVMVMTNYPEEQYQIESLKAGADYFFDKSNDMEKLSEIIDSLSKEGNEVLNVSSF